MDISANLAARVIVKHLEGIGAIDLPLLFYNEKTKQMDAYTYDGLVVLLESIVKNAYGEPDDTIPFSDMEVEREYFAE